MSSKQYKAPPDGGWGWVVCIVSMITYGSVGGYIGVFGILYVYMLEKFKTKDGSNEELSSKLAQVGSLFMGLNCLVGPIASVISTRIGIRRTAFIGGVLATSGMIGSAFVEEPILLYLTFGVLVGVGSGLIYGQSYAILGQYFKRRIGLVSGLYSASSPVFAIILTLAMPPLIERIGVSYGMLVMAVLPLLWMPLTQTWIPLNIRNSDQKPTEDEQMTTNMVDDGIIYEQEEYTEQRRKSCIDVSLWRNRNYVIWVVSMTIVMFGYFVPLMHFIRFSKERYPNENFNLLNMYLYITSGFFRLAAGKLTDIRWVRPVLMNQLSLCILAACYIILPFVQSYEALIALSLLIGAMDGFCFCLLGLITFKVVRHESISQGYGFLLGIISIPLTAGPPLAGLLYDKLGNYDVAFYASGGLLILGALLQLLIRIRQP